MKVHSENLPGRQQPQNQTETKKNLTMTLVCPYCPTGCGVKPKNKIKQDLKGIVSRDFEGLQIILMDRTWVPHVPIVDCYFLNFCFHKLLRYQFKVLSGLSFYLCTYQKLSVRPETVLCSPVSSSERFILLYK